MIFSNLTAQRSADALNVLGTPNAQIFLAVTTEEVRQAALAFESEQGWFQHWKALFTTPPGFGPNEQLIQDLRSVDPIIGWTAANVLRRLESRIGYSAEWH